MESYSSDKRTGRTIAHSTLALKVSTTLINSKKIFNARVGYCVVLYD